MANLIGYTANVAKSVIFATANQVSEQMSTVKDFKETNSDLFKTAYSNIINYKQTYKRVMEYTEKSQVYTAGVQLKKSLMEDLRDGTFYNNKRLDQISAEQAGAGFGDDFGGDFEGLDDFNFDDEDFDIDDKKSSSGSNLISTSINQSSEANANAVSTAIVRSAEYSAQVSKENTNLLYIQNTNAYTGFSKHLGVINDNIGSMMPVVDFTKKMMENQSKYYEESMKQFQDQTALLREISTNMKTIMGPEKKEEKRKKTYGDVAIGGVPDIKEYMSRVKENILNNPDLGLITSTLNSMGDDTNVLKMLAANPLGMLMEGFVNKFVIGKNLKKSMGKLDKTAGSLFGSLTAKLNGFTDEDRGDNPFTDKLRDLLKVFSADTGIKRDISTSKYNKGDMKWNGLGQKALTEVIPQQISKIISLLSGMPAQIFDYEQGIFKEQSSLKKEFNNMKQSYADSSTRDIETEMKSLSKYINMSYSEQESLFKDMKNMLNTLYEKGILFEYNNKNLDNNYYNISDSDNYEIIKSLFQSTNKDTQKMLSQNIMRNRADQKTSLTDMENKGNSIYTSIENKLFGKDDYRVDEKGNVKNNSTLFYKNSPLNIKSEKGYSGFWYLDQLLRELRFIRNNIPMNGISGNGSRRRRPSGGNRPNIDTYDIPDITPVSREEIDEMNNRTRNEVDYDNNKNKVDEKYGLLNLSDYNSDVMGKKLTAGLQNIKEKQEYEKQSLKQNKKSFLKDLMSDLDDDGSSYEKIKSVIDKISTVIDKPNEIMSKVFDKVDNKLYTLIYGTGEKADDRGFTTIMIEKMKNTFDNFASWLDDKVIDPLSDKIKDWGIKDKLDEILERTGLKDVGKSIKTYLFGDKESGLDGLFSEIGRGIKSVFSEAWDTTKGAFSSVFSPITSKIKGRFDDLKNNGTGGPAEEFFTKTLNGNVTSHFGPRTISKNHTGIDIGAAKGSFIKSPIGGRVSKNMHSKDTDGFGNLLVIDDNKDTQHYFGHMNSTSKLKPGDVIRPGQNIGNIGSTGNSTGPHLHYETRKNGNAINPDNYYNGIGGPEDDLDELGIDEKEMKKFKNLKKLMNSHIKDLNSGKITPDKLADRMYLKIKNMLRGKEAGSDEYNELKKNIISVISHNNVRDNIDIDKRSQHYDILKAVMQEIKNPSDMGKDNMFTKFFEDVKTELKNGATKMYSGLMNGNEVITEEKMKDDRKKIGNFISDASKGITTYAPEAVGSALLGSGVSLVTGMMGGPLLGAAIGAGISITKHSEKIQNWLFGEEYQDENGESKRKGGFVGKMTSNNFVNKIKKVLPDMKNYGIVGGVAGLIPFLPFGPIPGIMLGASFGYAKSTGHMKEWLFGKDNESWLGKKKEKMKSILPKMGAGALVGAVAGPFGLIGNAAIGSALGFATTTEKFQNLLFGKPDGHGKYIGGLLPHFKEKIIDPMSKFFKKKGSAATDWVRKHVFTPLKDAVKPFGKQLQVMAKGLGKGILKIFDKIIESSLGVPLSKLVAQIGGPIGKFATWVGGGLIKKIVGIPLGVIGGAGNLLRKHQIKVGTADYMSAGERLDFRKKHMMGIGDNLSEFDQLMDGFGKGDSKKLNMMRDSFANMKKDYKKNNSQRVTQIDEMGGIVSKDLGYFKSKKIMKLIKKGKTEEAIEKIKNSKLSDGEKEVLFRSINPRINKYNDSVKEGLSKSDHYKNFMKDLEDSGITVPKGVFKNPTKLSKYIDLLDKEINTNKKKNDAKSPEEKMQELQESEANKTKTFREKLTGYMEGITTALHDISHPAPDANGVVSAFDDYNSNVKKNIMKDSDNRLYYNNSRGEKEYISEEELNNNKQKYDTKEMRNITPNIITNTDKKDETNKLQRDESGKEYHMDDDGDKIISKGDKKTQEIIKEETEEKKSRNKMMEFISGKVEKVRGKLADNIEKGVDPSDLNIGSKLIKFALATAFAPQILKFASDTIFPWVSNKVAPFLVNTVAPAMAKGIGFVLKESLIGVGKWMLNGLSKFFKRLYNSTLAHLPGLKPISTDDPEEYDQESKNLENEVKNGKSSNNKSINMSKSNNAFLIMANHGKLPTNDNNNSDTDNHEYEGINNLEKTGLRYIVTGGKTGTKALKFASKIAKTTGKVTGKLFDVGKTLTHPIKSILGKTEPSRIGNLLRGAGNLTEKGLTKIGKAGNFISKAYSGIDQKLGKSFLGKKMAGAAIATNINGNIALTGAIDSIKKFLFNLTSNPAVEAVIGSDKCAKIVEKFIPKFTQKLGEKLSENIGKVSARLAGLSTGGILNVAFAIYDFATGYKDAQSTLGILEEPSFLQKVGCGLMKAMTGLTIVLSFLPDDFLINLIFDTLLPIFGVDNLELQKQRAKAEKERQDYNKKNNTDLDMKDYINRNNNKSNKYTIPSSRQYSNDANLKVGAMPWDKVSNTAKVGAMPWERMPNNPSPEGTNKTTNSPKSSSTPTTTTSTKLGAMPYDIGGPTESKSNRKIFTGVGGSIQGVETGTASLSSDVKKYADVFNTFGKQYNIDPAYLEAIAMQESGGDANSNNGAALGLMQIENGGTTDEFIKFGKEKMNQDWSSDDRADPNKAVAFAAYRISNLVSHYSGDYLKATQAYNFSQYSLDPLIKQFGDDWINHRKEVGQYNGTGNPSYGDSTYAENVLRYYTGNNIGSGSTSVSGGSGDSSSSNDGIAGFFTGLSDAVTGAVGNIFGFNKTSGSSSGSNTAGGITASGKPGEVIKIAQSLLGTPYVYGGSTTSGFDCSGFVQYVFKKMGVDVGRTTYDQKNAGIHVDQKDIQAGDIVLFNGSEAPPSHVGIYLGDGKYIHAPHTGDVIKISDLSSRTDIFDIRRVITDGAIGGPIFKFKGMGGPIENFFADSLKGNITSGFGLRNVSGNIPKNHTGIDIGASKGTSIKSPISGTVVQNKSSNESNGFGNLLVVKDGVGGEHYFGHMNSTSNLKPGDNVSSGQNIGNIGSTGNSTGPHLHYETRANGVPVNPDIYMRKTFEIQQNNGIGGENEDTSSVLGKDSSTISSSSDIARILNSVVTILSKICTNTDQISQIVNILSDNSDQNTQSDNTKDDTSMKKQKILNKIQKSTENNQDISISEIAKDMESLALGL